MSIIKIENLSVQYLEQEEKALDKISLEVEEGEFIAILGAHGAGKTTLCLSINGIVPNMIQADMFGKIEVAGEVPPKIPVRELASKVGSVFDNPEFQMSQLTVFEEVALGLQNLGVDKETIIGLTKAIEIYLKKDWKAEFLRYKNLNRYLIDSFINFNFHNI